MFNILFASEKFKEIYNFAFGWAKEKVHTYCHLTLFIALNNRLYSVMISGSEVIGIRYSNWDVEIVV